jgi:hypothetical protein
MSKDPKDTDQKPQLNEGEVTSTGMPWSEVGDFALPYAKWLDGRHGPAEDTLPSLDQVPIPTVLFALPVLHEDRRSSCKRKMSLILRVFVTMGAEAHNSSAGAPKHRFHSHDRVY